MTLLGDYWFDRKEHLPSAALVQLLAEFDISEPSARAALNRLTKRRLLVTSKRGRKTYYGLDSGSLELLSKMLQQILAFGDQDAKPWDGMWTMVSFSVPEDQRQLRHSIRTNLRWLGYAALYDGLWCSPWDSRDAALEMLADLGVSSTTVMRAEIDPRSTTDALSAWDLDALREKYLAFEEEFSSLLDETRRGDITASHALVKRTEVMDSWRQFLGLEPDLPEELLPRDWPRARMRSLFLELYDSLAPVAKARCQQIVTEHSPELAALVGYHTAGTDAADSYRGQILTA
jgi:phenylacetic acid degradation operon negative regulatory protein